jgi:hypothetical protein
MRGKHVKKLATGMAGALLLLASLTACGGDDDGGGGSSSSSSSGDYCDDLQSAKEKFESLGDPDSGELGDAIDTLQQLGDEAPDEVAGDWQVLTDGLTKFQDALDEAGVSMDDLSDPQALKDLDPDTMQNLTEVAQSMSSEDFAAASKNIEDHAKSECDVDLGDTGGGS